VRAQHRTPRRDSVAKPMVYEATEKKFSQSVTLARVQVIEFFFVGVRQSSCTAKAFARLMVCCLNDWRLRRNLNRLCQSAVRIHSPLHRSTNFSLSAGIIFELIDKVVWECFVDQIWPRMHIRWNLSVHCLPMRLSGHCCWR